MAAPVPLLDLTIEPLDIRVTRLASDPVSFVYTQLDGSPEPLTGATGTFQVVDPNTGTVLADWSSKLSINTAGGIVTLGRIFLADFEAASLTKDSYLYHLLITVGGEIIIGYSAAGAFKIVIQ